ncbi:hypothetical protein F4823DRAFT_157907 [Ustulina deusta]|nr:hypothetical protein F4823DRAFT_157907 [Ustulina deusta]
MIIYLTTEEFTCGHTQEIINHPCNTGLDAWGTNNEATGSLGSDTDTRILNEIIPIPTRCLACTCQSILDVLYGATHAIPRSYVRDLNEHVRALSLSASKVMRRELRLLGEQVQCLDDIDEFRKGVIALAGYPEVRACFGL